jgi:hypothetical protein
MRSRRDRAKSSGQGDIDGRLGSFTLALPYMSTFSERAASKTKAEARAL